MKIAGLDDSEVLAVLVYGRVFSDCPPKTAQKLATKLQKLSKNSGVRLTLVPTGDFTDAECFPSSVVIGVELARAEATQEIQGDRSGSVQEVLPAQVEKAKSQLAGMAEELWALCDENELAPETDDDDKEIEGLLVASCGPLAAGWANELQVSAEGTPWERVPADAPINLQAQYD